MGFYGWKPYVPVAKRRAKAEREMTKLTKKGQKVQPVAITGRTIATTFWGKGWCDHMESFHDYANRLPRGRTYVRNGSVCHMEIKPGRIEAMVCGSSLYRIAITVKPLAPAKWKAIRASCAGKIGSLLDLLRGRLASGVMEVVAHRDQGLFPLPGEIEFDCSCPDWASMCKHVAAVLYGVGARLDTAPEQLFLLRGVNHEELVDLTAALDDTTKKKSSRRRLAAEGVADVFGIDIAGDTPPAPPIRAPIAKEKVKKKSPPPVASPVSGKKDGKTLPGKRPATVKAKTTATPTVPPFPKKLTGTLQAKTANVAVPAHPPFPKKLTGAAIRKWRESLHLTQKEFAGRIGVTPACVSAWEGKSKETLQVREATLASLMQVWKGRS